VQRSGSDELGHAATSDKWGSVNHVESGHIHLSPSKTTADMGCDLLPVEDSSEWEDVDVIDTTVDDHTSPSGTYAIPTRGVVRRAAQCKIVDEWGEAISFGELLPGSPSWLCASNSEKPPSRLVVFFVGHWWCGLCHDYALGSIAKLSPASLIRDGVRVVIVSSGSWKVIAKYRAMFHIPFPVYVDRGTRLYSSLGMGKSMPNPFAEARLKHRPSYHQHAFTRQMVTGMVVSSVQFNTSMNSVDCHRTECSAWEASS
jgi:hypothetical protein